MNSLIHRAFATFLGNITLPPTDQTKLDVQTTDPLKYIKYYTIIDGKVATIINETGIIVTVVAFLMIVYYGFMYLTAGGNESNTKKAAMGLVYTVIGMVIVELSWGIYSAALRLLATGKVS